MAPNMTGITDTDNAQMMLLAELTLEFAGQHLKPGGALLTKVFQGAGFMELRKALQESFGTLATRKPAASRDRSAELYLLAKQKKAL
jgi:23S rRNA (uridine2552-2'-O)-methyltransferase